MDKAIVGMASKSLRTLCLAYKILRPTIDLETKEDWLEKANAIVEGLDYDTRVSVPLELSDEDLLTYMKAAHERDMTFNQFVEEAIRQAAKDHEQDPEGFKQRMNRWKNEKSIL